jgi:uncharacterized protein (TIGR02246 family)
MQAEITALFENYQTAFNRLDGEAVADLYAVPSGIASDAGYTHWATREPIAKNMVALCEQYRKKGFASAVFQVAAFLPQGENFAIADLAWTILWTDGQGDWHFNTTYNIFRTPDGWRVLLCTAYSETKLPAPADNLPTTR